VKKRKAPSLDHTKFLSDEERKYLESLIEKYRETDSRNCLLLEVAMKTGIRAQEILNLRKQDLLVKSKSLFIRALKGGRDREMPLDPKFLLRLKKHVATCHDEIFFISYTQLNRIWDLYRPNKDKTFHCLRHTFAIGLYKKTKDLKIVQMALGHRDSESTMIYLDYINSTSELRKAILGK
jgi:integrase